MLQFDDTIIAKFWEGEGYTEPEEVSCEGRAIN